MIPLTEGQPAPTFEGIDQSGNTVKLSDFSGKKVIIYFYPKDNTPGCTAEACSLRDGYSDLINSGFSIIGISPDSVDSHKKFIEKYNLPFILISDPEKKILLSYGVFGEKTMYGKKVMGVIRTTFLIDEKGIIFKIIRKVDTKNHAAQIVSLREK